ncbi:MAG: DUF3307 domain-containing protein [Devosia sp.]
MSVSFFVLLLGFEIKHFVADYLLQTGAMIRDKGDLRAFGGYAHAGVHVLGSAVVLLIARVPVIAAALLLVSEFVARYAIDFAKAKYGRGVDPDRQAKLFWGQHGFDQLLHQLTYAAMIYFALRALAG